MLAPALSLLLALRGDAPDPAAAALVPEYEITVADAGSLKRLVNGNAWMGDFQGSNLYRGTMVRLGPLFFAVGQKGRDAWEGRLLDFAASRLLDGHPARLAYVDAPHLVSPFGVTLPDLAPAQRETVKLLLAGLRSGADVPTPLRTADGRDVTVAVTPLAVKLQKLAAVVQGPCLVVARDPRVAASLSLRCASPAARSANAPAGLLEVDVRQLFPAGSAVLAKLVGLEGHLRAEFNFDPAASRFVPSRAELALGKGHLVREGTLDEGLLGALPAATVFTTSLVLPDPGALDAATMETYLKSVREKPPSGTVTVTFASLGTRFVADKEEALTAILLPRPAPDAAGLETLFTRTKRPVTVSHACPGLLVLSPSPGAIAAIEEACAGRAPSLRQLPPTLVTRLGKGPAAGSAYLNVGRLLSTAMELGWARQKKSGEPPPEVKDALDLLDRLPRYAFSGRVEGDALRMRAATHSPAAPAPKAGGRKS